MVTLADIEAKVMDLSVSERAALASRILRSLPTDLDESQDWMTEVRRRDAEMDLDPSASLSYEEFKASISQ